MIFAALPTASPFSPRPKASLRAWKALKPSDGSIGSLRMRSGLFAATSSMSIPPALDAMKTGFSAPLSTTRPR